MNQVTIREFTRNIYKHLKEGTVVVTVRGEEKWLISMEDVSESSLSYSVAEE